MSRRWFATPLETVATFWRVLRRDGITLGFTTHDRDLWIDGVLHSASPGMVPSSIRRSADLEPDSAEVRGALSHQSIAAGDLAGGRFDDAEVMIGVADWQTGETHLLYRGKIGMVSEEDGRFAAELSSRKLELARDPMPRTSPSCRAVFCGPGCHLNPVAYSHEVTLAGIDVQANAVALSPAIDPDACLGGSVRWLDGVHAGMSMAIAGAVSGMLMLDAPIDPGLASGLRLILREGCDRTLVTCASRFDNAVNFQGEPFLPGNDLLVRYPLPAS